MGNEDIGKYRDRSRDNERPKDLDGVEGARRDILRNVRRLRMFLDNVESYTNEGCASAALDQAKAAAQNMPHLIVDAAKWQALSLVAEGVYKNPKEES